MIIIRMMMIMAIIIMRMNSIIFKVVIINDTSNG